MSYLICYIFSYLFVSSWNDLLPLYWVVFFFPFFPSSFMNTGEPHYNQNGHLETMKWFYQVSCYIRIKTQKEIYRLPCYKRVLLIYPTSLQWDSTVFKHTHTHADLKYQLGLDTSFWLQSQRDRDILKGWLLETANFSHPFYGTPRVNTFITF